ncbi:MAG: hypothetical protein M0Z54_02170 [Thermaerobacter sp.]|nr:hypothetical protein [Thermaerobacter sp.]
MDRSVGQWLGVAAAVGLVASLVVWTLGAAPLGAYIGDVFQLALLVVAFLVGRRAIRERRRPGWLGGLAGVVGGFVAGLGDFGVRFPVSRFHTVVTAARTVTAAQQAAVANSVGGHLTELVLLTLVMGVFGIIAGTIGGATGRPPGTPRAV